MNPSPTKNESGSPLPLFGPGLDQNHKAESALPPPPNLAAQMNAAAHPSEPWSGLLASAGPCDHIVQLYQDITEPNQAEEKLRESEQRFREMIDALPAAIYTTDAQGALTHFNPAAVELSGRTPTLGTDHWCVTWKLFYPDGRPMPHHECPMATALKEGRAVHGAEAIAERPDGTRRWFEPYPTPLFDARGKLVGGINMLVDITERKEAEKVLHQAQAQLADHALQLEASVQERTAQLQSTIGELEHFSYTITHDMRAPLRAMQAFAVSLLSDSGKSLTPQSADYLNRIIQSASRMDALIRDSLQYAKLLRGTVPLSPVQPAPLLRGIIQSYPALQTPGVNIRIIEPLPAVLAHEGGLTQCFSNLLINAVKFIKPGTAPEIRIWAELRSVSSDSSPVAEGSPTQESINSSIHQSPAGQNPPTQQSNNSIIHQSSPGGMVRFWFKDNGIGIPDKFQQRIFEMFQQLDNSYEGTGIGLALVRKAAERMGGRVGVESEPGKGSRFWLELKQAAPPAP